MLTRARPDECYRCEPCELVFIDDQIAYEQHLAREHGYLQDTLPSIRGKLEG